MAKHRVTTHFRNRFGFRRTDVRVVDAHDSADLRRHMQAISEELQQRPGVEVSGGDSEPI